MVFLNINQNLPKNGPQNDNFSHFAKHRFRFFETKNIDAEQKT